MNARRSSFTVIDPDENNDNDFNFDEVGQTNISTSSSKKHHNESGNESPPSETTSLPPTGDAMNENGRKTVTKLRPASQLLHISSESDSESDDAHPRSKSRLDGEYDPKMYEDLDVSSEVKELFQYITKYVPQQLALDHKFKPFIPDYIPAVGDIDAFLKVIPPDEGINGEPSAIDSSDLGLVVLDEPAANQSDPAVLHLQLRAASVNVGTNANVLVKKVDNVEKNAKVVDKWIKDISDLHRSKSSPVFKYSDPMPDLDELMEEWPEAMENLLKIHGFPSHNLSVSLTRYIDVICSIFDIPVYANNRIQSLHLLFSLYAAVKTSHLFKESNRTAASTSSLTPSNLGGGNASKTQFTDNTTTDQLLLE